MKVDITLTVGGNDVTIDIDEARKIYLNLASLLDSSYYNNMMSKINEAQSACKSTDDSSIETLYKNAKDNNMKNHRREEDIIKIFKDAEKDLSVSIN